MALFEWTATFQLVPSTGRAASVERRQRPLLSESPARRRVRAARAPAGSLQWQAGGLAEDLVWRVDSGAALPGWVRTWPDFFGSGPVPRVGSSAPHYSPVQSESLAHERVRAALAPPVPCQLQAGVWLSISISGMGPVPRIPSGSIMLWWSDTVLPGQKFQSHPGGSPGRLIDIAFNGFVDFVCSGYHLLITIRIKM